MHHLWSAILNRSASQSAARLGSRLFRSLSLLLLVALVTMLTPAATQAQSNPLPPAAPDRAIRAGAQPPADSPDVPGAGEDWQTTVQEQIRRSEYQLSWQESSQVSGLGAAFQAPNRAHNLRTYFTPEGITVIPRTCGADACDSPAWQWSLTPMGYGRGPQETALPTAGQPQAEGNRATYDYAAENIQIWYINTDRGLEQGFTLTERPAGDGPLWVSLRYGGNLQPNLRADGQALEWTTAGGVQVLRYDSLLAYDANGQTLPAHMAVEAGSATVRLVVEDTSARYPLTIDPLAATPAWTAESDQAGAYLGDSVHAAGDVNGDGYDDVIVGAPGYDNGQTDEGRAYVYLGSAAGLGAAPAWTAESDQASAQFGYSVSAAGDVNGDGYDDVIVGTPYYDNGQTDEGRAYVYLGSAAGLAAAPAWTAESNQASAQFGYSVSAAGDVNGDGYDDVIAGTPYYDNGQTDEGRAFVFHGSAAGLSPTAEGTAEGNQASAYFGWSVSTAGDVNGDGYDDVIIGTPDYDNGQANEGSAFVYHGSAGGLGATPASTAESNRDFTFFGWSVSAAGDVNGDGYDDVIVGTPYYDNGQANEGGAYVYYGSSGGLSVTANWIAESNQTAAGFGGSVSAAGDVNGDGYDDVMVGAFYYANDQAYEGRAFVYHGAVAGLNLTPAWTAESNQDSAYFGWSVSAAGDVNGDGYDDVIVGARYYSNGQSNEGRAFVYQGTADGLWAVPAWTAEGDQVDAQFGWSVSAAGDVNGDGYGDVMVGAPFYDNGQVDEGRAFVYHSSAAGLSLIPAWIAESNQAYAEFGIAVSAAGDVNGDGYGDVMVGAFYYTNDQAYEGRAFVYHGSAAGLNAAADWTAEGDQANAWFGYAVSAAVDVNNDGYDDVIVGAYGYDNGQAGEGRAYVYHGSAGGLSATAAWTAESDQAGAQFGWSVSAAGDINSDGYGDVIVGAPTYDNGQTDEGRAFVYHGAAAGLNLTPAWTAESDQAYTDFGVTVGAAGDVNGDGYSDVIVGAPYYSNGQPYEGRAFVYHGATAGLSAAANWMAESDQADAWLGWAVSAAGDFNSDGYDDIIVGAPGYDNGLTNEGHAFIYHGSVAGLRANAAWVAEGNQEYAEFGVAVSAAGDVNGDGYGDVIVGAWVYDSGQTNVGRAFVYLGAATSVSATAAWTAESNQGGARFASTVSTAGDVNGDGYGDVIVGAPFYDNGQTDEGGAFVYHGSAAGLSAAADWTTESNQVSAWFGYSVSAAGDVNGDGYGDVIIGAPEFDNGQTGEGRAFVYYGAAGGLGPTAAWTAESDQSNARFGWSVSAAGDINNDSYGDVIAGAWLYDNGQTDEGRAFVFHGSAGGLSATPNWTAESDQADAHFGVAVSAAGDVNGDGYGDVIMGAHEYDNSQLNEGRAYVYHGASAGLSLTPAWTTESGQVNAWFGYAVSAAGDVNGDGYGDVIIGAYGYDNGQTGEGRAFVFHGSAGGLNATAAWTAESDQADALFGWSVSAAGDVNGDGYGDAIIGVPGYDDVGQFNEGHAYIYHGSAVGLSLTANWMAESDKPTAEFGFAVSAAGDVNNDGYSDVIVGVPGYDSGEVDEGRAFVYYSLVFGAFNKNSPANEAINQPTSLTLSWGASSGATSYDYCYDTTNDNVCTGPWASAGSNTSVNISGLSTATTYYWQVRSNSGGTIYANRGTWWSFITAPPPSVIYVSSNTSGTAGGISFADEDVLAHDLQTGLWYMVLDGSDLGLVDADVDAFSVQPDGSLLLSLDNPLVVGNLGLVDDSDIMIFYPDSLGATTAGTFELFWDGSAYGLTTDSEDVDALAFSPDGRLLVSTIGKLTVAGLTAQDEDLSALNLATGTWSLYFDGSDVGLAEANSEDVYGAAVNEATGDIYLTTLGLFDVPGVSGDGADVLLCAPASVGNSTSCTYTLFWDGSAHGLSGEVMDALELSWAAMPRLWLSTQTQQPAGGLTFSDEDVFAYDPELGIYAMVFDGSDVGVMGDVDAFSRLVDGSLLLSVDAATDIPGLGTVDDSDILRFSPTTLGLTTAGTFELYFDGSAYGLTDDGEDIDAVALASDGRLLVSTVGNLAVDGLAAQDEDLSTLDLSTGNWSLYFDGSDVALSQAASEDVNGLWLSEDVGQVYLTTVGAFDVPEAVGDGSDILLCQAGSLGNTTSCTYSLYWDGSAHGVTSGLDGLALIMP